MKQVKNLNAFLKYSLLFLLLVIISCKESDETTVKPIETPSYSDFREFSSFEEFKLILNEIVTDQEDVPNRNRLNTFLDSLELNNMIPFIKNDSVLFIYYGEAQKVSWAGDFNGWNSDNASYAGINLESSDVWILEKTFPSDARLDYKIVKNGSNWILDPRNSFRQMSGFGWNSELRMPAWIFPFETVVGEGVIRGSLSENTILNSKASNLGYNVQYKVYTPFNYNESDSLPVLYITDGHEYADDNMGAVVSILDNLIYNSEIKPLMAVFIDPRDPSNLNINRRGDEYTANIDYTNFVADELVGQIDSNYKTRTGPESRAIMGTSLGGWNSAFFGMKRSDAFGKLIIHSPAFDNQIISDYSNSPMLPLKIFMSTGVIYDTEARARNMKTVFDTKGYDNLYIEVNEGHSWGNWRALIDDALIFHFSN